MRTKIVEECLAAEKEINQKVNNGLLPALRRYQITGSREHFTSFARSLAETIVSLTDVSGSFDLPLNALLDETLRCGPAESGNYFEIMMQHMTKEEMGERYSVKGFVS